MSDADPRLLGFRDFFVRPVLPVFPVRWLPPVLPVWKLAPPSERPDSDGVLSALLIGGSPFVPRRSGSSDGPLSSRVSASGESAPLLPVLKDLSDILWQLRDATAVARTPQTRTVCHLHTDGDAYTSRSDHASSASRPACAAPPWPRGHHRMRTVDIYHTPSFPHSCAHRAHAFWSPWGQALVEGHASNSISLAATAVNTAHVRH